MRDEKTPQPPAGDGLPSPADEIDLQQVPFAAWLEKALPEICRMDVRCIGFVALLKDGSTATNYWNAVGNDVALMAYLMTEDALLDTLRSNKELLRRILEEEETDGPE